MDTTNTNLQNWVNEVAKLTTPDQIHWCDGSEAEYQMLVEKMLKTGDLSKLNPDTNPNSYLHRSATNDVARTEHLTFICTKEEETAGPNNNWLNPEEGHKRSNELFKNCMKGRTMYVLPYCMGPINSPYARCGVEITDSPYVAVNMKIMTRMGEQALKRIEKEGSFVKGLHSTGDLSIERRLIMHFPEESTIKSIGSGYGGNALLGKKCHALRIASFQGRQEGWLAEHMLIVGLQSPEGETHYIAAAFPSACGKTNLAMLIPPEKYKDWKVWTVGDDIAWMHIGEDGRLYAINPEAGFFGVAPGTSSKTNPNALNMLRKNAIFTNVATTENNEPWWEGLDEQTPKTDWKGNSYDRQGAAAHPNSRFTVSAKQCDSYSKEMENPNGVPISAIVFGGRRPNLIPLVYEAKDWNHGVLVGASVASETTAAATGQVGVLRHDPMAMKPFCGYNFADYWQHWLSFRKKSDKLPKIFHVNWFRQGQNGEFLWPGFGENIRVLSWIINRVKGTAEATSTPVGYVPTKGAIDTDGLNIGESDVANLCEIDKKGWLDELHKTREFLNTFGDKLPAELIAEHEKITSELGE